MKSRLVLAALAAAAFAFTGCSSESKTASPSTAAANAKCPMTGKAVDGTHTVSYKGQNVGFCCGNCPANWAKLSDADKDAKLAAAKK